MQNKEKPSTCGECKHDKTCKTYFGTKECLKKQKKAK